MRPQGGIPEKRKRNDQTGKIPPAAAHDRSSCVALVPGSRYHQDANAARRSISPGMAASSPGGKRSIREWLLVHDIDTRFFDAVYHHDTHLCIHQYADPRGSPALAKRLDPASGIIFYVVHLYEPG